MEGNVAGNASVWGRFAQMYVLSGATGASSHSSFWNNGWITSLFVLFLWSPEAQDVLFDV